MPGAEVCDEYVCFFERARSLDEIQPEGYDIL